MPTRNLVALALFLNALLLPYIGIAHDGILYAGLVENRIQPGCLGDDLFFRFGSQDRFTIFSHLLAPLAKLVGVSAAFAIGYALSVAIYTVGMVRLVRALVPGRVGAFAALVGATCEANYGGLGVFAVPEGFLTPRLPACGFALLALERALAGRWRIASLGFLVAMLLHPLMAIGPACVAILLALVRNFGAKLAAGAVVLVVASLAGLLANEPLAAKLFGTLDPAWKDATRTMTRYNFANEWTATDWLRLAVAGGVFLLAARAYRGAMLACAVAVAVVGVAVFIAAGELPYAFLFQGQAYRAVWLLAALQLPLACGLAAQSRWFAAVPLLLASAWATVGLVPGLADLQVLAATVRGDGGLRELAAEFPMWPQLAVRTFGVAARGLLVVLALAILPSWRGIVPMLVALAVAAHAAAALQAENFGERQRLKDMQFVAEAIRGDDRPTVFWAGDANLWDVWHRLPAKCYHHPQQAAGSIYAPATAAEAERRTKLTRRFWVRAVPWAGAVYRPDEPAPTVADFRALAADPEVTWIVLPLAFEGVPCATNGSVYVYDARKLR